MYIRMVLAAVTGYLLGSLNSSLITGKFYGVDIRKHGSGNAGATNMLRTLGKKAALFVLAGDFAKGVLAYLAGCCIYGGGKGGMLAGTAAILGHVWPVFFRFKGGKGVLTSLAVLLLIDWPIALGLLCVFTIILLLTRYVSLGSIVAAFLFPLVSLIFGRSVETVIFSGIIAALIIIKHRTNIRRLLDGTESKFSFSKKQATKEEANDEK
ncbi:MAG: glycerol-3-phosphate 1-O-acyltransferase PlsY [Acetivibrionales bacterium]|jgi:glycerol-3-phosphate acyltransferase PlsY